MCEFEIFGDKMVCKNCGFSTKKRDRLIRNCPKDTGHIPSFIEKVKNLGGEMIKWAKSGFAVTEDSEEKKRFEICTGNDELPKCEFFQEGTCTKCGCNMNLKVRLLTAHCPVGKW